MSNPAITAALIAASRQQEVEEAIEGRLTKAKATGPTSAVALDLTGKEKELLDQAVAEGTVKTTSDGRYYLNERAIADRKEGQGFMVLLILLVAASIMASGIVLVKMAGN
ncbi:hypothetical protein LZ496_10905 [Sphingomonas sp. NSE70-1]|uniref:Uncharacterized protein n=1 Tax=Sphingomonas caseinilyticus TaxID=2908205 RepID=A0ABT0RX47_9SPHN|nr:hypothetical protein [Sphingomonas caseinilyticus]MCL6699285.1 hypothetical protein [Sphingomonas caseinilyticus]